MGNFPFADFQADVLKEIGNIGAGHAATALSKMIDKQVDMRVPKARLLPFDEIALSLGGEEVVVTAIFLRVIGDAPGNMFFIFSRSSSKKLLRDMIGLEVADEGYSELERSALSEIGNILAGSYLSSLSDFIKLNMQPTVPSLAIDMAGAVLSYGMIEYGYMGDQALLIDTTFMEGREKVEGHFFFIPDPDSVERIFRALGVPTA